MATVTGGGSLLQINGIGPEGAALQVGRAATGSLDIANGGQVVSSGPIYIGALSGVEGTVTVNGAGSLLQSTAIPAQTPAQGSLQVGRFGTGTLLIENGGAVVSSGPASSSSFIGAQAGSTGTVTVTDAGSSWSTGGLVVGEGIASTGTLSITNGGQVQSLLTNLGTFGADGVATVSGQGSNWNIDGVLVIGTQSAIGLPGSVGTGTLMITNGGQVESDLSSIGGIDVNNPNAVGTATVSGEGSAWSAGLLQVGLFGKGTLLITNGGLVESPGGGFIGSQAGGEGTVTVSNDGTWTTGLLVVGGNNPDATGTLTIESGGLVTVNGATIVASAASTIGTINDNDGGTLQTQALQAGSGTAQVNFNGASTLRALANNLNFITGFSDEELNIGSGVLIVDTQGFTVGTDTTSAFTGDGGLTKVGIGTLILDAPNTYSGPTTVAQGTLAAGDVDVFSPNSPTTVNSGATLALQGFNQTLDEGLDNEGAVVTGGFPGPTTAGTMLTVAGNYVGTGGRLVLDTFLGTDNAPSDQLVINGGTGTGLTVLTIHNTTGPGALTTANGIPVVVAENGATTTSTAFTLGGAEVRAGEFTYDLFRGPADPPSASDLANTWFLRSDFIPPPPPPPPPPVPPPPPPPEQIIGPEIATYGVVQPIAREMGLMTLGTLQQRRGDTAANLCAVSSTPDGTALITKAPPVTTTATGCCPAATPSSDGTLITKAPPVVVGSCGPDVWGRFFGQQVNNEYQQFADPRASGWMGGFQGGADLYQGSLLGWGRDVAGLYVAYSDSTINVDGLLTNPEATANIVTRTGKLGLNAFSTGGYWTHYFPGDAYLDAVLQGTWYFGGASTQFASLPINGSGFVSSLEGGYPIPLPFFGLRFVLEPQAQIIYQRVAFDNASDTLGPVDLGTTSGATGRLGLRGQWTIVGAYGAVWQPYVGANVWQDWGAQATTTFGIDPVPLNEQATRLEFTGGLNTTIDPHLSFFVQGGYQFAVSQTTDGVRRNAVQGDVGVRYQW